MLDVREDTLEILELLVLVLVRLVCSSSITLDERELELLEPDELPERVFFSFEVSALLSEKFPHP